VSTDNQPVSRVRWIARGKLRANNYNPNAVAPPELDLLRTSIIEDGWTSPICILPDNTIVDGFHRWTVSATPAIRAMTGGMVPVVTIQADPVHRMMSTGMVKAGMNSAEICRRLGMEDEELERLLDRSGMTVRGSARASGFGRAWVPGREG